MVAFRFGDLSSRRKTFLAAIILAQGILISFSTRGRESGLIEPGEQHPITVEPGQVFYASVRLRLPLTPPPGVQQREAKEAWRARLIGVALTPTDPDSRVSYPMEVLRIRPEREETYRIYLLTRPWMLPGTYDFEIQGPGFSDRAGGSVRVQGENGKNVGGEAKMAVKLERQGLYRVFPSVKGVWVFDVVVPPLVHGLDVTFDGRRVQPTAFSWVEQEDGFSELRPVLRFAIPLESPGRDHTLALLPIDTTPCTGYIRGNPSFSGRRRLLGRELLLLDAGASASAVAWDFGDGKKGTGNPVRHRFLLQVDVPVTAAWTDPFGRTCQATWELKSPSPTIAGTWSAADGDCGCRSLGRTDRTPLFLWLWRLLGEYASSAIEKKAGELLVFETPQGIL